MHLPTLRDPAPNSLKVREEPPGPGVFTSFDVNKDQSVRYILTVYGSDG